MAGSTTQFDKIQATDEIISRINSRAAIKTHLPLPAWVSQLLPIVQASQANIRPFKAEEIDKILTILDSNKADNAEVESMLNDIKHIVNISQYKSEVKTGKAARAGVEAKMTGSPVAEDSKEVKLSEEITERKKLFDNYVISIQKEIESKKLSPDLESVITKLRGDLERKNYSIDSFSSFYEALKLKIPEEQHDFFDSLTYPVQEALVALEEKSKSMPSATRVELFLDYINNINSAIESKRLPSELKSEITNLIGDVQSNNYTDESIDNFYKKLSDHSSMTSNPDYNEELESLTISLNSQLHPEYSMDIKKTSSAAVQATPSDHEEGLSLQRSPTGLPSAGGLVARDFSSIGESKTAEKSEIKKFSDLNWKRQRLFINDELTKIKNTDRVTKKEFKDILNKYIEMRVNQGNDENKKISSRALRTLKDMVGYSEEDKNNLAKKLIDIVNLLADGNIEKRLKDDPEFNFQTNQVYKKYKFTRKELQMLTQDSNDLLKQIYDTFKSSTGGLDTLIKRADKYERDLDAKLSGTLRP